MAAVMAHAIIVAGSITGIDSVTHRKMSGQHGLPDQVRQ
jgi:hypothetical protein